MIRKGSANKHDSRRKASEAKSLISGVIVLVIGKISGCAETCKCFGADRYNGNRDTRHLERMQ